MAHAPLVPAPFPAVASQGNHQHTGIFPPVHQAAGPVSADSLKSTIVLTSLVATPLALAGFALQLITYFTSFRDVFAPPEDAVPPPLPVV